MKSVLAAVLLLGTAASAGTKGKAPTQSDVLKQASFEEINGASNYLLAVVEAGGKRKYLACDPDSEAAQAWLSGPVHALYDGKRQQELDAYLRSPAAFTKRIDGCLAKCSCQAFSELLDDVGERLKGNAAHLKNAGLVKKNAEKETAERGRECARQYKAFCKGVIRRYLQSGYS